VAALLDSESPREKRDPINVTQARSSSPTSASRGNSPRTPGRR
jgi:hypothetical protein